jgi:tRNA A37 threonylcarbamoyladenosine biosynthesis protein TsaE
MLTVEEILHPQKLVSGGRKLTLTPAQESAAQRLIEAISPGSVLCLRGQKGMGKTTVLDHIHRQVGGATLNRAISRRS